MDYILFIIGITFLIKGADCLVTGASSLAEKAGISKLTIGLAVVSVGTSFPELGISIFAAARSSGDVVLGNILGSCITNILLILGIMALITNLEVKFSTTWKEIPFAFLAAAVLGTFSLRPLLGVNGAENAITRSDGIVLFLFLAVFMYYVFDMVKKSSIPFLERSTKKRSWFSIAALLAGGAAGLYLGGEWTVAGAINIARALSLSEFLISATIVAIGTSLPELTTAIAAVRKDDVDLAVGNIIGSNILNIFMVLGLSSLISPLILTSFMKLDVSVLLIATFLLFLFMFTSRKHELDRWEGLLFLGGYVGYITFIIMRG